MLALVLQFVLACLTFIQRYLKFPLTLPSPQWGEGGVRG
jgi:hypothetical protein